MYCLLITRSNDRFSSGLSPFFFLDAPFHRRHAADGEDGAPELAGLELHYAGVFAGVHPAVLADEIGEEIDQVVARGAVAVEVGREAHPKLFFGGFTLEDGDKDIFRGDSLECFFHDDLF